MNVGLERFHCSLCSVCMYIHNYNKHVHCLNGKHNCLININKNVMLYEYKEIIGI